MRIFWSGPLPAEGARCVQSLGAWQRKASASDPVGWLRATVAVGLTGTLGLAVSLLLLCERSEDRAVASQDHPGPLHPEPQVEKWGAMHGTGPGDTEVPWDLLSACQGRPSAGRGEGAGAGRGRHSVSGMPFAWAVSPPGAVPPPQAHPELASSQAKEALP